MLRTARLTLVPHDPNQFEACADFWSKPPGHGLRSLAPMRAEDAWTRLLRFFGHWQTFDYAPFLGYDAEDRLVFEGGLADCRRGLGPDFDSVPEAMWKVDTDSQGRGYAGEAMAAILDWFDRTNGAPRTVCMIDPENVVSLRVAARLGFAEFARRSYRDAELMLFERRHV